MFNIYIDDDATLILPATYTSVLYTQLTKVYGKISAANTITDIVPIVQTGDLHIALYDLSKMIMHISVARRDGQTGPQMAYDRTFMELDMNTIFAEAPPTF